MIIFYCFTLTATQFSIAFYEHLTLLKDLFAIHMQWNLLCFESKYCFTMEAYLYWFQWAVNLKLKLTYHTFVIKQTFYLQTIKAPKVTLGILFWILNEHSVQIWEKKRVYLLFICVFRKYMFCVQLHGKWAHWGYYDLYFEALKGLLLKNASFFFFIFAENVTLLYLNII